MNLADIEGKIKSLVDKCQKLKAENKGLSERCEELEAKNSVAASQIEKIVNHLKTLEEGDYE